MRSFCFEIIYGILLIVQKGHSTPDGQRVALNVRPLQPKRFFLAKPAVQTEGAEYAGAWFYDYTHQNIDLIGQQSLFLFRFSVRGDFDTLSRIINDQMIQTCFLKKLAHSQKNFTLQAFRSGCNAGHMVDILVATGSKNGSISVAGTDVAIKGLAALAYKAKISQSDLDDALAAVLAAKADKATTLGGYGITDAYTKDEINAKISAVYKPAGSVVFSALPALAENVLGNVYNVTDAFTTTNNFVEGAGNKYPKGTNVVVVKVGDAYKYDVLAGFVDLSGYVEKEAGKGLSDENFTAALKDKLDGIEAGANKYVHPTHTAAASGLYKTTVDEEGHVTATAPVTKDDITKLGIPAKDTTYDEATTAKDGLMSAADKTKLDGMDTTIDKAIANHTATDAEVSEMLAEIYGE